MERSRHRTFRLLAGASFGVSAALGCAGASSDDGGTADVPAFDGSGPAEPPSPDDGAEAPAESSDPSPDVSMGAGDENVDGDIALQPSEPAAPGDAVEPEPAEPEPEPPPPELEPLPKFVGNITTGNSVDTNGLTFSDHWDQITPENAGKWGSVQNTAGAPFNWGPLDAIYDYAEQNGIIFKEHTFVWGS